MNPILKSIAASLPTVRDAVLLTAALIVGVLLLIWGLQVLQRVITAVIQ